MEKRQGRGPTSARQHSQHLRQLWYLGAAPAKLSGNASFDKPGLLQEGIVVRYEEIILIDVARALGKVWGETIGDVDRTRRRLRKISG